MFLRHRSPATLPKPNFPVGVKVLYTPEHACVDICFVHGITGDRENTWTANGQSEPWPKIFLPHILPQARILTFGYDAYFVRTGGVSTNGLDEHAISLVNDLVTNRRRAKVLGRPLILVAHSLGGIVCKEAVLRSKSPPPNGGHLRDIYESLTAVAFMGTPHRGAWQAKWAAISVSALGFFVKSTNEKLLRVLRIGNELTERTNDNFSGALDEKRNDNKAVHVTCFFEEMTMPFGGVIVERESASLDNALPIGIHANHSDMVKFATPDDTGFMRLSGELERWVKDIVLHQTQKKEREATTMQDPVYLQCMRDLCRTNPEDDRKRIERTKGGLMTDVCEWIFDNDDFQTWTHAPQKQCLWIRGDPGKGKTMLMSGIITRFAEVGRPMSYVFCQAADGRLNNALGVLLGLVYCLLRKKPCLISHLRPTYEIRGREMFDGINAWDTLGTIFTDMCCDDDAQDVVLLIDALDECRTGLSEVLNLVATTHTNVRWIVSSRNYLEVEESMAFVENTVPLRLELNELTVSAAVETYIRRKVDELAWTKSYTGEVKRTVHQYLSENAQGTFLWVALVCEVLSKRPGRRHTEADMRAFPPGLSALYRSMMETLLSHKDDASESLRILKTVATALHPLSLHELAMVLYPDEAEPDIPILEEMVKLCSSFVTIRDGIVYFVHLSASDYLSNEAHDTIFPSGAGYCHLELCVAALTALTSHLVRDSCQLRYPGTLIEDIEPHQTSPLAPVKYVCLFWAEHLEKSHQQTEHDTSQLETTVSKFLRTKYLQWLEAMSLLGAISSAVRAMLTLKATSRRFSGEIATLVQDAYELAFESRYIIGIAPLQVYASALVFCPSENRVRKCFSAEEPDWITTKPIIQRLSEQVPRLEGHTDHIRVINMSSDGSFLVSDSYDGTLKIWDMETFTCIRTIKLKETPLFVAISTGGTHAGAVLNGVAVVWDVKTSKPRCKVNITKPEELVQNAFFSPCLQRLSVFYQTVGVVWDMETAKCIRTEQFGQFRVCFKSEVLGRQYALITTSDDIWIRCRLDLESWDPIGPGKFHFGEISADGRLLAVQVDTTIVVWDLTSPRETPMASFDVGDSGCAIYGFTPDGLITGRYDTRKLEFRCGRTGECTSSRELKPREMTSWITPDGRRMLCYAGYTLTVHDLNHTQSENEPVFKIFHNDLTSDGSRLVTASSNHIWLWDTAQMTMLHHTSTDSGQPIDRANISTDGSRVVVDDDDCLLVWEPAIDNTPRCFSTPRNFESLRFTPDLRQTLFFVNGYDTHLLDIDTGNIKPLTRQNDFACDGSISPDGMRLAIAYQYGSVDIWDLSSGDKLNTLIVDTTDNETGFYFPGRVLVLKRWGRKYFIIWDTTPERDDETPSSYRELKTSSYQRGELQLRRELINKGEILSLEPRPGQSNDKSDTSVYKFNDRRDWITSNGARLLYIPQRFWHLESVLRGQVACFMPKVDEFFVFRFQPDTSHVVPRGATTDLDLERDVYNFVM